MTTAPHTASTVRYCHPCAMAGRPLPCEHMHVATVTEPVAADQRTRHLWLWVGLGLGLLALFLAWGRSESPESMEKFYAGRAQANRMNATCHAMHPHNPGAASVCFENALKGH